MNYLKRLIEIHRISVELQKTFATDNCLEYDFHLCENSFLLKE